MNISGSGSIAAGEYNEKISVSGSGRLNGDIRCVALSCSGAVKGLGSITCTESLSTSGGCHFEKDVHAKRISVSGSCKVGGDIVAEEAVKTSGSLACDGRLTCATLASSGSLSVGGDIEAEEVRTSGLIRCGGLLNAEKIDLYPSGKVGSIGGSEIRVHADGRMSEHKIMRMPLLSKLVGSHHGNHLTVEELVEGDVVALEYVTVPKVVGRVVAIGEECVIDLVQYSEEIEIHPKATVEKIEKI